MARIRFIKPEFFSDAKLVRLPPIVRLFYIGLFVNADKQGRFIWDEEDLKIKIIPYDKTSGAECLDKLMKAKRILQYGDKGQYGLIVNFLKHQYINPREPDSKIPQPSNDILEVLYQSDTKTMDKGLRIKDREREQEQKSLYLKNIPDEDCKEFLARFEISPKQLMSKGEDLYLYCKSNGKKYSDYKSMLLNALKKDFREREIRKTIQIPSGQERPLITQNQAIQIPEDIKNDIKKIVGIKQIN